MGLPGYQTCDDAGYDWSMLTWRVMLMLSWCLPILLVMMFESAEMKPVHEHLLLETQKDKIEMSSTSSFVIHSFISFLMSWIEYRIVL